MMNLTCIALPSLWVAVAVALVPATASAQRVQNMTVHVATTRVLGPLPGAFRPSVMMSWADDEAIQTFLALPGKLGTVRLTLEPALTDSTSLADYRERLRNESPRLKQLAARGATLVLTFARMPRWLASNSSERSTGQDGFSAREASPPADLSAFSNLAFETVRAINVELGMDVLYEFWNEPEAKIFWGGTQQELLSAYSAFASGARRADPKARVGGLGGSWNERRAGEPDGAAPLLKTFIDFTASPTRLPLDFVSWHNFPKYPEEGWEGAGQVRAWLIARALPAQTPQIVTEWNQWSTFPNWFDPPRDDVNGATFMLASLHQMSMQGVSLQTMAALQDFRDASADVAFPGDFGLLTRAPVLKKASFHAMNMLAILGGQDRVVAEIPAVDADAQGVDVLATAGVGKTSVLLSRHAPTSVASLGQVFARSLRRSGITLRSQIAINDDKMLAFAKRQYQLVPSDDTAAVRQSLETARSAAEQARSLLADEIVVTLNTDGVSPSTPYRIYRIDATHLNPGRAYRDARANRATQESALAAARAQQAFAPISSGFGAVPALRLPTFSALLIVFGVDTPN